MANRPLREKHAAVRRRASTSVALDPRPGLQTQRVPVHRTRGRRAAAVAGHSACLFDLRYAGDFGIHIMHTKDPGAAFYLHYMYVLRQHSCGFFRLPLLELSQGAPRLAWTRVPRRLPQVRVAPVLPVRRRHTGVRPRAAWPRAGWESWIDYKRGGGAAGRMGPLACRLDVEEELDESALFLKHLWIERLVDVVTA
eukprot:scaffold705_cov402-Prasinococcus_capsulatus_cf.AAC.18